MHTNASSLHLDAHLSAEKATPARPAKARSRARRLQAQVAFCRSPKVDLNLTRDMLG